MIHLRHKLSKRDFVLDVDIQVPDTGITGVFGESGSGKTWLMRNVLSEDMPKVATDLMINQMVLY